MKYKVLVDNRFGEGWQSGDIVEMDENSARVPLERGEIELYGNDVLNEIKEVKENKDLEKAVVIRFNDNIFQNVKDLMLYLNLFDAKKILYKLGLDFWLANGTLLGFYREGKFILSDKDVDLGLFDYDDRIIGKFEECGFDVYKVFGNEKSGLEISLIRNGYKLDLHFYKKKKDGYYQYVWKQGEKFSYKFPKFGLEKAKFYGMEFNIPDNTEKHLEAQYGNWEEVIEDWDYVDSPKNVKKEK